MNKNFSHLRPGQAWVITRFEGLIWIKEEPVVIYMPVDVASSFLLSQHLSTDDVPKKQDIAVMMDSAYQQKEEWPEILYVLDDDPAANIFSDFAEEKNIGFEKVNRAVFDWLLKPIRSELMNMMIKNNAPGAEDVTEEDMEKVSDLLPDTYDPCPCGSGKKFKFCCKPIYPFIINAMADAEEGHQKKALEWLKKAESKVGQTAEVLCRYAIVYSFSDMDAFRQYLEKCLEANPNHPRANYIKGIEFRRSGDLEASLAAYKTAIDNYPESDHYHLNEAWNNIGSVYYDMLDYAGARHAWEKALEYLPGDKTARDNLDECIFGNPDVPDWVKG